MSAVCGYSVFRRPVGRGAGVAAVIVVAAFARSVKRFETRHFRAFIILRIVLAGFGMVLYPAGNRLGITMGLKLEDLKAASSP